MSDEVVAGFCNAAAAFAPPLFCEGVKEISSHCRDNEGALAFPDGKGQN
jgi:hypothetical protein